LSRILIIFTLVLGVALLVRGLGINSLLFPNVSISPLMYLVLLVSTSILLSLSIRRLRRNTGETTFCVSLSKLMPDSKQIVATKLLERLLRRSSTSNVKVSLESRNDHFVVRLSGNLSTVNDIIKMLKKIAFGLVIKKC